MISKFCPVSTILSYYFKIYPYVEKLTYFDNFNNKILSQNFNIISQNFDISQSINSASDILFQNLLYYLKILINLINN